MTKTEKKAHDEFVELQINCLQKAIAEAEPGTEQRKLLIDEYERLNKLRRTSWLSKISPDAVLNVFANGVLFGLGIAADNKGLFMKTRHCGLTKKT